MTEEEMIAATEAAKEEVRVAKEEAEAIRSEKVKLEEEKSKMDEDLRKLRNKDFNFRRLEQMTQEEKDSLTEQEIAIKKHQEELDDKMSLHEKSVRDDWRNAAIEKVSGGDQEKAKRIVEALKDVVGDDTDRASIEARVRKAAKLCRDDGPDPLMGSFGVGNGAVPGTTKKKSFVDTEEGKEISKLLGI